MKILCMIEKIIISTFAMLDTQKYTIFYELPRPNALNRRV